jgi:Lon protease-like protein
MAVFEDFEFAVEQFSGRARLFPLPNLALFPHVMQPLHVFEPRYRELLEEALVGDKLIAMALLSPGWESNYEGRPPVYPMACLGRIAAHHRLPGGAYNVLLVGLRRIRLLRELPATRSFREAEVLVFEDRYPQGTKGTTAALHRQLRDAFLAALPELPQVHDQLEQLLSGDASLGTLTDVIGYMLDLDLRQKQALLSEVNVHRRAEQLLKFLRTDWAEVAADACQCAGFPPDFSVN